ncbi:LysR family transcriptional regulator [Citrobacter rodentium]|uniref:LysR-family transcriptional regulator n=2 Tax=Citrobacter rodentium TaxID=67825 RepID=D2TTX3_CITRI|nr:LysR family transcriptional regulator [Citrobacter rodentium]KIQ49356.1 LysR family transcriptional regulator [Citrobacter rodentium]QBY27810.1 LysR family transcriptional regulator [Citrobacter rodentium]UHO30298.1 LysR family transcriptional regulator [Citrobacter rodentium NBRC 105723 = DSM 16636]CBG87968.1 LysR-family transcriptional regulator [Citrobacter rodentium ICC168]HAT8012920.1 LysR family transcriptional regulator [Citrobacter rodentium NBRC 105723 = DSM 16636]
MHLDFRQLRNFVALVEYGSFNRAAEAVCLSQSAFSRSIQALEQSVGHALFYRQSKLPTLTPHGQTLLPYARRFQELNIELSSQLREADDAQSGEVAFGCGPAPGARLIPLAVGDYHRRLPQVRVCFHIDNWFALHHALTSQQYPFVVADSWQAELDPQLRVQPLSPQRCFFVCHADHPLAQQGPVSVQAMLRYPFAAPYLPPGVRKVLATLSQQQDFTPAIQCDHTYALFSTLAHTDAISFASEDGFALCQNSHRLVKLELSDLPDEWRLMQTRFAIISPVHAVLSPLAETLIETILHADRQYPQPALAEKA